MGRPEETGDNSVGPGVTAGETAEQLWTIRECCRYLQMSENWIYRQVEAGAIPHARLGRMLRFHPARIREYAASMMNDNGGGRAKVIPLRKK